MGKTKLSSKTKPPPTKVTMGKKPPKKANVVVSPPPLDETALRAIPGVPDESVIQEAGKLLSAEEKRAFTRAQHLLAEHLGSQAAARLWLVTPGTGFKTTALDAVREGQATLVLATLQSQWGKSPSYA